MAKKILILLFVLGTFLTAYPQELKFGLQTGIGTYSMEGLKNINDYVSGDIPFDTKITSDFPAYFYYRPSVVFAWNRFSLGLIYTMQSTGSRITAKDYSGSYRFDMKLRAASPGIYCDLKLANTNNGKFSIYSMSGVLFSKLGMQEVLNVNSTEIENSKYTYKALNFFLEPGLNYSYNVKSFTLGLSFGYSFTLGKQAYYSVTDKDRKIYDPVSKEPLKPEWNGLRTGISLSYTLAKQELKQ